MNEQNAATKVEDATAAQLIAAIYTAKDASDDYAVRRELNRAAGHIRLALDQEAFIDGPAGDANVTGVSGGGVLGSADMDTLQRLATAQRLRAEAYEGDAYAKAGAIRELRRASGHLLSATIHSIDAAWPGDKVPAPQAVTPEGIDYDPAEDADSEL